MYSAKGNLDHVSQLRRGMRDKDVKKDLGFSWIKNKNMVPIFSADDKSSPFSDQIYEEVEKLNYKMIEEEYVPDMSSVLHNVEEPLKTNMLNYHREKWLLHLVCFLFLLGAYKRSKKSPWTS
ncbi:pentatricopeptide repeat-containing At1g68930 [Olea europaea subsp. europaea]|uniref:Pentatricopeptide repeat-containing At1g68930 n=1 Tax=Olea europaea subsp. europaea TaxID=158383 RepID=A0A8S0U5K7_OLEEU|nr:pentatricopeptide repeat-containing At1g68930 [Olea europaea subsp. europaea]